MTNKGVVVVGSANMDLVVRSPRFPLPGETILGNDFRTAPGGKGANQAVAIGKLGGKVEFVANVGSDAFGEELLSSLKAANVNTSNVTQSATEPTGVALISVNGIGQNTIIVASGANMTLDALAVRNALECSRAEVVITQLETPLECAELCSQKPVFILNPAPARNLTQPFLSKVDIITPNETEAETLTGVSVKDQDGCEKAAHVLHDMGVSTVIITLGANGIFLSEKGSHEHFDSMKVKAVDTTAAGDAFNGSLAWFLSESRDLRNAVQLANCVAALSVTKPGAQSSMPNYEDLKTLANHLL